MARARTIRDGAKSEAYTRVEARAILLERRGEAVHLLAADGAERRVKGERAARRELVHRPLKRVVKIGANREDGTRRRKVGGSPSAQPLAAVVSNGIIVVAVGGGPPQIGAA